MLLPASGYQDHRLRMVSVRAHGLVLGDWVQLGDLDGGIDI